MAFRPVLDAMNVGRFYTPPGTGTNIAGAAAATTPPLGMAPSTAAPGIGGGSSMPVDPNQAILQQANINRARTNQFFPGLNLPTIQPGTPQAIAQIKQTNLANAARGVGPAERGGNAGANRGGAPGGRPGRSSGPGAGADEGGPGARGGSGKSATSA